ncbi:YecA family protein [Planococcus faecalis]|uniref:SEC-C domain-containing protein n=1 Tax=Planococcus faecalis TaxID=1598147 RepID=A0ABM6IUF9_9BACL|nr:SEC-C domain-containing protein [Planococcus faecalis]AQU80204.1 hypothetical protein AJGP001_13380 [Planococcus faecalis]OHX51992.1 hypothetical protein BB777_03735 [Planococcus faecalis]
MSGRNDACPCGSGKKYKKCHGQEQTLDLKELTERELAVINRRFIDEGMNITHVEEMIQRDKQWFTALEAIFPPYLISDLSFESYAYIENRDVWVAFVKRELKNSHRTGVTRVLEAWLHPLWILAEVLREKDGVLEVKDEMSGIVYTIKSEANSKEGDWLFGIAFYNSDAADNRLQITKGLLFILQHRKDVMEAVYAKLSDFDNDSLRLYCSFEKLHE